MADPAVSVVLPVYRNRATLDALATRLHAALDDAGHPDHELFFVDDACPERSLDRLEAMAEGDPRIAALGLEENVGQYRAVLLGVASSPAARTVVMDADLQDPPEAVPALLEALVEPTQVVFGGRRGRYQSWPRMAASKLYRSGVQALFGLPRDAGIFMALARPARDALLELSVARPFPVVMVGSLGLPMRSLPVERASRPQGRSAYGTWGRVRAGVQAIACGIECRWGRRWGASPWQDPDAVPGRRLGRRWSTLREEAPAPSAPGGGRGPTSGPPGSPP